MRKTIVVLAAVAFVSGAYADIFATLYAGYGIAGNGDNGGIVDNVNGTEIVLQLINGGGNGLDYAAPGIVNFNNLGEGLASGNDVIIGQASTTVDGSAYSDWAAYLTGIFGGNGTAWSADTYVRVSGVNEGNWVWEAPITLVNGDYSDSKTLSENTAFDNGGAGGTADGSTIVHVIPEPATLGLMGVAGLGMFLARKKARR